MDRLKILNVEDDDVDCEAMRRMLAKLPWQMEVHEASTLNAAAALLRDQKFDCVLLDLRMGDSSGFELIPAIQSHREEACPIIMVTASDDGSQVVDAMREGVYDYIAKNKLTADMLRHSIKGSQHWAERETQLSKYRRRMEYLSFYDSLTGLPNRALLFERLDQMIKGCERSGEQFAVLMMDLNLFKEVNDCFGHDAGDEALRQVAERIAATLRKSDTVARLGGDEFVALVPRVSGGDDALAVAQKAAAAVQSEMIIQEHKVTMGICIGIALYPLHGSDRDTLLKHADHAMYAGKKGVGGVHLFHESPGRLKTAFVSSPNALDKAIARGEMRVHFQPQVDMDTRKIIGKEALVRWMHPKKGMLPPNSFIPVAEKSRSIFALTDEVLRLALDEEAQWRAAGVKIPVSVNISPRLLDDTELLGRIVKMIEERGLTNDCLTLELTETALVSSAAQARANLTAMSDAGFRISIDDFGSGYTSFRQLRDLNISEIKIDGTYIVDVCAHERDASIVRSIVELGRGFNTHVIAECVETKESWPLLRKLGCNSAQGFSIGKPMTGRQFDQWVEEWMAVHANKPTPMAADGPKNMQFF